MRNKFATVFDKPEISIHGKIYNSVSCVITPSASCYLSLAKDKKDFGFKIGYTEYIQWDNGASIKYYCEAVAQIPNKGEKPAVSILANVAKDILSELQRRFKGSPGYEKLKLPKAETPIINVIETVKKAWAQCSIL